MFLAAYAALSVFTDLSHRQPFLFEFFGWAVHGDTTEGGVVAAGCVGTEGCVAAAGCTLPPLGVITVDSEVAGVDESVSPDDIVATGASMGVDTPSDDPLTVMVGVMSVPNVEDAGPALPPLLANIAAAAPPITAERMMAFLFEDFSLKMLVCGIITLEIESL